MHGRFVTSLVLGIALAGCAGARETPAKPTYTDAEWHWAEGWCANELGGYDGVELWDDERPTGFTSCVHAQLPRAAKGLKEGRTKGGSQTAQQTYCTYIAPPAVADDPDQAWIALGQCLREEFGIE